MTDLFCLCSESFTWDSAEIWMHSGDSNHGGKRTENLCVRQKSERIFVHKGKTPVCLVNVLRNLKGCYGEEG